MIDRRSEVLVLLREVRDPRPPVRLDVGAGRAVRVWDDAMRDGDAAADATVLQRVLEIVRPALFVSGHRLLDRGDDPAAALAAARFGMPCVGAALSCALRGDEVEILRKADKGGRERLRAPLRSSPPFAASAAARR